MLVHSDITEEERIELKRMALDRRISLRKLVGEILRRAIAEAKETS